MIVEERGMNGKFMLMKTSVEYFLPLIPHPSSHTSGGCLKPGGVRRLEVFFSSVYTLGSCKRVAMFDLTVLCVH